MVKSKRFHFFELATGAYKALSAPTLEEAYARARKYRGNWVSIEPNGVTPPSWVHCGKQASRYDGGLGAHLECRTCGARRRLRDRPLAPGPIPVGRWSSKAERKCRAGLYNTIQQHTREHSHIWSVVEMSAGTTSLIDMDIPTMQQVALAIHLSLQSHRRKNALAAISAFDMTYAHATTGDKR